MSLKEMLVVEEFKALQNQIDTSLKEIYFLERFVTGAIAATYLWLIGSAEIKQGEWIAWGLPFCLALLGLFRSSRRGEDLDRIGRYLLRIEEIANDASPQDVPGWVGWQHWLKENPKSFDSRLGRVAGTLGSQWLWGLLTAATLWIWVLHSKIFWNTVALHLM